MINVSLEYLSKTFIISFFSNVTNEKKLRHTFILVNILDNTIRFDKQWKNYLWLLKHFSISNGSSNILYICFHIAFNIHLFAKAQCIMIDSENVCITLLLLGYTYLQNYVKYIYTEVLKEMVWFTNVQVCIVRRWMLERFYWIIQNRNK